MHYTTILGRDWLSGVENRMEETVRVPAVELRHHRQAVAVANLVAPAAAALRRLLLELIECRFIGDSYQAWPVNRHRITPKADLLLFHRSRLHLRKFLKKIVLTLKDNYNLTLVSPKIWVAIHQLAIVLALLLTPFPIKGLCPNIKSNVTFGLRPLIN